MKKRKPKRTPKRTPKRKARKQVAPPSLPRVTGRPTKLTPEVAKMICDLVTNTKAPLEDAAGAVGVHPTTLAGWIGRGRSEASGPFHDFFLAIEVARRKGTTLMLGRIAQAAQNPKNWQAAKSLLEMTERRRFGPQVRIVEEELEAFIDRLEERLPAAVFDQVLAAADDEAPGPAAASPPSPADDGNAGSGEAVHPTRTE